jgi:hypothetical protein
VLDATEIDEDARERVRAAAELEELMARCAAALTTAADDTVISSITAARVHGLWLPPGLPDNTHLACAEPDTRSSTMTRSRRRVFAAHRHQLRPEDRVRARGLEVMSISRTWLDLARQLSLPDLVAAGDSALRTGATVEDLEELIKRSGRMRGIRVARAALVLLDPGSRSRPESHLRVAISTTGLPRFEVNVSVYRDGGRGWLAEPDLSLAEAKIALEYQGADHATVRRMRKDISREVDLRREGWQVRSFGPAEVFGSPWEIAPEVRGLIRDRAPHLLRPRPR